MLAARPTSGDALVIDAWHRKVEGIGREIDVCFAPAARTVELNAVRAQVAAALAGT